MYECHLGTDQSIIFYRLGSVCNECH